ncbi:hypothetical protein ACJJTC_000210 [Scirpophaga incertulas]
MIEKYVSRAVEAHGAQAVRAARALGAQQRAHVSVAAAAFCDRLAASLAPLHAHLGNVKLTARKRCARRERSGRSSARTCPSPPPPVRAARALGAQQRAHVSVAAAAFCDRLAASLAPLHAHLGNVKLTARKRCARRERSGRSSARTCPSPPPRSATGWPPASPPCTRTSVM